MSDSQIAAALGSGSRGSLPVGNPVIQEARGEIHECRRLRLTDGRSVFIKQATTAETGRMLREEAIGMARLSRHVRVPEILAQGEGPDGRAWLATEWLQLLKMDRSTWSDLGGQLAALHAVSREQHGLNRCNFVGAIPQGNMPADSWMDFFIKRRLRPQLSLAEAKGYGQPEALILAAAQGLLHDHNPRPALLHGNLSYWNVGPIAGGKAVFLDPAPYYGDPEIDLVRLGWRHLPSSERVVSWGLDYDSPRSEDFLDAYGELPSGYQRRLPLYEVYSALVELNLYSGKYPESIAQRLDGPVRRLCSVAAISH